jgi:hypothetical protein
MKSELATIGGLLIWASCTWPTGSAVGGGPDAMAPEPSPVSPMGTPARRTPGMPGAVEASPDGSATPAQNPSEPLDAMVASPTSGPAPTAPDAMSPVMLSPDASLPVDAGAVPLPVDAALAPPDVGEPAPPKMPRILRVRDVTTTRLMVTVVYAHKLDAMSGKVVTSAPPLSPAMLDAEMGPENLKVDELVADVLYAHDLHTGTVQIQEGHISQTTIKTPAP